MSALDDDGDPNSQSEDEGDEPIVIDLDDRDEESIATEVIAMLGRAEVNLYVRAGQLVRVVRDAPAGRLMLRPSGAPRIVRASDANIRETIAGLGIVWMRGGSSIVRYPGWLTAAIRDRGEWSGLRQLQAVIEHPALRADGSILSVEGYDASTGLMLLPSIEWPAIKDRPTRADAIAARDALLEVVEDFAFAQAEHRASWLAAVLTVFARFAFFGPVPLVAIDKNCRAAGGTLCADAVGVIATGEPLPRMTAATSVEESRKVITSIALAGYPLVLLDNIGGTLGDEALDAALTATSWSDRLLGSNTTIKLPLHVVWIATGNNLSYHSDTLRRVLPIRIEVADENPESRTGFAHPQLLAWIRQERPRLVAAALTILRAWHCAGRPTSGLAAWGSFEAWSDLVRAAVAWCGLPDPARAREELGEAADDDKARLGDLLRAWRAMYGDFGASVPRALRDAEGSGSEVVPGRADDLRAAVAEIAPARPGSMPTARAVGKALATARQRVVGGLAITAGKKSKEGVTWIVREVSPPGDSGDTSDSLLTSVPRKGSRVHRAGVKTESSASPESPGDEGSEAAQ